MMPVTNTTPASTLNQGFDLLLRSGEVIAACGTTVVSATI
jgi:hypothetical protein